MSLHHFHAVYKFFLKKMSHHQLNMNTDADRRRQLYEKRQLSDVQVQLVLEWSGSKSFLMFAVISKQWHRLYKETNKCRHRDLQNMQSCTSTRPSLLMQSIPLYTYMFQCGYQAALHMNFMEVLYSHASLEVIQFITAQSSSDANRLLLIGVLKAKRYKVFQILCETIRYKGDVSYLQEAALTDNDFRMWADVG
jgi:hypothetical protein